MMRKIKDVMLVREQLAGVPASEKLHHLRRMRLLLLGLIETQAQGITTGLCAVLTYKSEQSVWLLHDAFLCWDEFSGSLSYPVPPYDMLEGGYNDGALGAFHRTWNLWDKGTEYGAARWRLVQHCLDYTNREITRLENAKEAV